MSIDDDRNWDALKAMVFLDPVTLDDIREIAALARGMVWSSPMKIDVASLHGSPYVCLRVDVGDRHYEHTFKATSAPSGSDATPRSPPRTLSL